MLPHIYNFIFGVKIFILLDFPHFLPTQRGVVSPTPLKNKIPEFINKFRLLEIWIYAFFEKCQKCNKNKRLFVILGLT